MNTCRILAVRAIVIALVMLTGISAHAETEQDAELKPAVTNSVAMSMMLIPAGEFAMGSPDTEAGRNADEVQHKVTITRSFLMSNTEVTQAQWKAVMRDQRLPAVFKGDDLPVDGASWEDAKAFCEALTKKEGRVYRLPTEAEWEYACRAGTTTAYSSGDDEAALREVGWFGAGRLEDANSKERTNPVAKLKPNAWGLYDMHGNMWEWCSDWYGPYAAEAVTDPTGPGEGEKRVIRGGDLTVFPRFARSAVRYQWAPKQRIPLLGFRVVLELTE